MKNLKLISILALSLMLVLASCSKEDKAKRQSVDDTLKLAESAIDTDGKEFEKKVIAQGYTKVSKEGVMVIYEKTENEAWGLMYDNGTVQQAMLMKEFESSQFNDYANELIINVDQMTKTYKNAFVGSVITNATSLVNISNKSKFKSTVKQATANDFTSKEHSIAAVALNIISSYAAQTQIQYDGKKFTTCLGVLNSF